MKEGKKEERKGRKIKESEWRGKGKEVTREGTEGKEKRKTGENKEKLFPLD